MRLYNRCKRIKNFQIFKYISKCKFSTNVYIYFLELNIL
ncbi:hypothetical protein BGAPBR_D0013 (plasmid) [Borreliella garinii PBr]|uniref:Uncharacterized protein n=1 Tax=Borreliella garinii PBr TaxID=498743 RepID=B8F1R1_BORGR|nr:hypothetical protein BGAPBR_D0013 [Borreliella garinii PBr]